MNNETATKVLGYLLLSAEESSRPPTGKGAPVEIRDVIIGLYATSKLDIAHAWLELAIRYGREWRTRPATRALQKAYESIEGGDNPGTGLEWHQGEHPIQQAARHFAM